MKLSNHHRKPAAKPAPPAPPVDTKQCTATTEAGTRCKLGPGPLCRIHRKQAATTTEK